MSFFSVIGSPCSTHQLIAHATQTLPYLSSMNTSGQHATDDTLAEIELGFPDFKTEDSVYRPCDISLLTTPWESFEWVFFASRSLSCTALVGVTSADKRTLLLVSLPCANFNAPTALVERVLLKHRSTLSP